MPAALGRRTVVTDPRSGPTFTTYNDFGVESVYTTDDGEPNGALVTETGYGYSETTGRLSWTRSRRENATYAYTRFGYSLRGELEKTWGDVPQPTYVEYDAYGQRTTLRTYRGGTGWDGSSWPGSPGDADETTWTYDPATGLLLTKTYADSTEVNYTYTEDGELYTRQWARHAATDVTAYGYDGATGELLSVTYDASFNMTNLAYTYDRLGRRVTVSDAAGARTFAYDAATLELVSETFTSGMFSGLVIKPDHEDGSGGTLEGRWAGLRVGTSGDDDSQYLAHYGYDAAGRLNRVTGPGLPAGSGASHGAFYTFVSNSDLVDQVRYKVDGGDVRAWVARSYEAERDLVTSVESNFGDLTTYTTVSKYAYGNDALARRTHVVRTGAAFGGTGGSGDHLDQWSYNNRNELTGSDRYADTDPETPEDPVTALNRAYAYDPIGNRVTSEDGAAATEWEYDANALNQYERVDTVGDALIRQGYSFDADGNLAEQWLIGDATCDGMVNSFDIDWFVAVILDPNAATPPEVEPPDPPYPGTQECWDRRLEWADVDGNGLINTFDIDPFVDVVVSGSAVARAFTWNGENKLVMAAPVQSPPPFGAQRVKFVYDYMGRRIEKLVETWTDDDPDEWVETGRIRYVYDGWLLLEELDAMDSNAVVRQYTWGLDLAGLSGSVNDRTSAGGIGGLLAVHDETVESGEDYLYLYDANGNVSQLVAFEDGYGDATDDGWHMDRLVARYEYDAYGRITGPDTDDDGDWRDDAGPYAITNTMRFSTKPWDDEIGWGNWGERLYDPKIGRWVNRDPIEESDDVLTHRFNKNNSINIIDPIGLCMCRVVRGHDASIISWFEGGPGYGVIPNVITNAPPPPVFAEGGLASFLKTREFRNYLGVSGSIACCNGKLNDSPPFSRLRHRVGFTNNPGGLYVQGGGSLAYFISMNDECLTIVARARFIVNSLENIGQSLLNWNATDSGIPLPGLLPFAWSEIVYSICCDGSLSIEFYGSVVPSHYSYVDGVLAGTYSMNAGIATRNKLNMARFEAAGLFRPTPATKFSAWNGYGESSCGSSVGPPPLVRGSGYSPGSGYVWVSE
ncbi:MAG: RHS repeat domain-containing protein [Phycisphaerae bacterium]